MADDGVHGGLTVLDLGLSSVWTLQQFAQDRAFQRGKIGRAAPARARNIDMNIVRDAAVLDHQHAIGQRDGFRDVMRHQDRGETPDRARPAPAAAASKSGSARRARRAARRTRASADGSPARAPAPRAASGRRTAPPATASRLSSSPTSPSAFRRVLARPASSRSRPRPTSTFDSTRAQGNSRGSWNITRTSSARRLLAEADAAGIDCLEARDQAQQRALAAAAAADDRDELAGGNMQVDAAQHLVVAEGFAQAADGERQPARCSARRRRAPAAPVR